MKFKAQFFSSLLVRFIANTCLLALSSTSMCALAAPEKKSDRWFEVEVILFKQLGNKNNLKEQFLDDVNANTLPQYKRSVDLFTPYLQPDLTAIKQFIPLCNNTKGDSSFSLAKKKLTVLLPEQTHFIQQANAFSYEPLVLTLSAAAEQKSVALTFDWQTESLNSPLFSLSQICVYQQADFERILDKQQLANFSLDGFAVTALPKKLNASGTRSKSSPYLIADNALLLNDISKRLRWSKEFKPLLHFGWRQAGVTRTKAIPLKLFAGQHVENDYQQAKQALNDHQIELIAAEKQTKLLFEQLKITDDVLASHDAVPSALPKKESESEQAAANYYAQIKQQALAQLFTDLDTFNDNETLKGNDTENPLIDAAIKQLSQQSIDDLLTTNEITRNASEQPLNVANSSLKPPVKPLQPWFLEGFFKLHLDHYLYITADFNLLSNILQSNTAQSTSSIDADQEATKLINFSQNRRVISGEIHYFDHPYIGMIVQIRRFDPSKPADEAISQAIK